MFKVAKSDFIHFREVAFCDFMNIYKQAENHRIYLMRFLNQLCEEHGVKAKDIVKSIVVIANNDFEIEENAIDFPIYRPVLVGRAIESNDCKLSAELISDIQEYIESNKRQEHKYKHILCPEIEIEQIEKIRIAIKTIIDRNNKSSSAS